MSKEFEEITEIASGDLAKLSAGFEKEWGKKLRTGHTDWVIEHDMLSEGHRKFTPPDIYFTAVKELWVRSRAMLDNEASAMEAQADLVEGQRELEDCMASSDSPAVLRAKAKIKRAESTLSKMLVEMKDKEKEMQCLYNIMKKYEPEVQQKYDCDIEKAQHDIWLSKYRYMVNLPDGRINNIALPMNEKITYSGQAKRPEHFALSSSVFGFTKDWNARVEQQKKKELKQK